jgi:cobalt-zinc-cadmium resistance protein CzcA
MPVERADMMIQLKPRKEWVSAKTQAELSEKMEDVMSRVKGLSVEMSQPIQMRTNELITGVKQDVAINIYGTNIDSLARTAGRVAKLIRDINGVGTPVVERVSGLPQLQVIYDRARLSAYGISIKDANNTLQSAFAGATAGSVFDEDRRFDIVLRIDEKIRDKVETLQNLLLTVPGGGTVPLAQVAEIKYVSVPSQITHDEGQRRIYVGFNVRGRDVESTISDIDKKLSSGLRMPAGYHYTYGGQFENLKEAKARLSVAIPVALVIILFLLFLTLKNIREVLIVFTEIPLAAIGGIFALWLRGMPFSISAGVGFIALFGVVVLNGIVLINQFNDFERHGITDINRRILNGCMLRLRPVLMTALVASLGFLPMAVSTGDGAEVQRPLATVVIGGLIIATILTLIVLPAIYKLYSKK